MNFPSTDLIKQGGFICSALELTVEKEVNLASREEKCWTAVAGIVGSTRGSYGIVLPLIKQL